MADHETGHWNWRHRSGRERGTAFESLAELTTQATVIIAATPGTERACMRQASLACQVTTDVQSVITHPDVEAIFVITPPNTHRDVAMACLRTGKHVLVSKPIEISARRGQERADFSDLKGLRLGASRFFNIFYK